MKIKVTYLEQREVSVIVNVKDGDLIKEYKRLGDWKFGEKTEDCDPRWQIEELAYQKLTGGEIHEDDCFLTIIDRKMEIFNE